MYTRERSPPFISLSFRIARIVRYTVAIWNNVMKYDIYLYILIYTYIDYESFVYIPA